MIRAFSFKNVPDENNENWRILSQKTEFRPFTPETTLTGVDSSQGYYMLYGPMVFIFLYFVGDGTVVSWGPGTTIDVPIEPWTPTTGSFPQELNPPVDLLDNTQASTECPIIASGPDNTGRITFSSTGSGTGIKITGFYIRN